VGVLDAIAHTGAIEAETTMNAILIPLVALFSGIGILLVGNGLLGTLLGVRAVSLGFSLEVTGVVMSAYFAGFIAGSLGCVYLIERAGHIRTFAAMASIASAVTLAFLLFDSPVAWAILRAILGFCFAGLYMVTESWLNDQSDNTNRGRVLSIYMMVSLASLDAGQPLLLFPNPGEFEIFCVASVLVSLGLVPVALTSSSAPAPPRAHPMGLSSLYQVSPLGVAGCFASGLALGAFWSMAPVFCKTLGLSEGDTVIFMVATILGGLFLLWPLGRLSDRLDRRRVLTLACAVSAAASAAMVWTGGGSVPALFGLAIMFGGFTFPIYSIAVAHANDFLEPENLVSASSALLLVYGCGAVLGPLIAGLMMGWMGAFGLYALLSGAMIVTVFFALFRMLVRAPLPVQEQEAVVFVPRTTHVAYELDPRAEPHESE
jgi:MFS family permease